MANYTPNGTPRRLTGDRESTARVPVDQGQTGFFERREFRISVELNVEVATPLVFKFSSPVNFILWEQSLSVDANMVKFEAVVGGTPGGTFATPITIWGKNRMNIEPEYAGQVTISTGGSASGGQAAEVLRVKSSGATGMQTSIGAAVATERGLPAGDYYLRLTAIGGTATGTFSLVWEERP